MNSFLTGIASLQNQVESFCEESIQKLESDVDIGATISSGTLLMKVSPMYIGACGSETLQQIYQTSLESYNSKARRYPLTAKGQARNLKERFHDHLRGQWSGPIRIKIESLEKTMIDERGEKLDLKALAIDVEFIFNQILPDGKEEKISLSNPIRDFVDRLSQKETGVSRELTFKMDSLFLPHKLLIVPL